MAREPTVDHNDDELLSVDGDRAARASPPWPLYAVGIAVTGFAMYMLYVAFHSACLTNAQMSLMRFLLSMAGGFLAWTFAGQLSVRASNLVPGLAIAGTGGFGVFIVCIYVLEPNLSAAAGSDCTGRQTRSQEMLGALAIETANTVAQHAELKKSSVRRQVVHRQVKGLIEKATAILEAELTGSDVVWKLYQLSQLYTICALTSDMASAPSTADGRDCALRAMESIRNAFAGIEKVETDASMSARARSTFREYVAEHQIKEALHYMQGFATMFLHRAAEEHNLGSKLSVADVVKSFNPVSHAFLQDHNAVGEDLMQWFCGKNSDQKKLCEV